MESYFKIELIDEILFINFLRSPTPEEYCRVVELVAENQSNQFRLYDFSCGLGWSTDDMRLVTRHSNDTLNVPSSKIAIVAPDNLTFGNFRVHGSYRDSSNHEQIVFRKREEAEKWLRQKLAESRS